MPYNITRSSWYLKAPDIVRKQWTIRDQFKVYTLSQTYKTTQEVIDHLGKSFKEITKTQIHNQTRLLKAAINGKCRCGEVIPEKDRKPDRLFQICKKCIEKNKIKRFRERNKLLKKRVCPFCRKNRVLRGHKSCIECLSATYRRRVSQGMCGICGENNIDWSRSVALCECCLDKQLLKKVK